MIKFIHAVGVGVLLLTACGNETPNEATSSSFPIEKIAGKWEDISKDNAFYEDWRVAAQDSLSGKGYVLIQQDTVFIEDLAMWNDNGVLKYAAGIANQKNGDRVVFTQTAVDGGRVIFENHQHDFPQRIIYELISNVEMHVLIDGTQNGKYHKEHFSYIRK